MLQFFPLIIGKSSFYTKDIDCQFLKQLHRVSFTFNFLNFYCKNSTHTCRYSPVFYRCITSHMKM